MCAEHTLQPDLDECTLEDRVLLYLGPGLSASPFFASSTTSPGFIVSGFQNPGSTPGGSSIAPGPAFYNALIGIGNGFNNSGGGGTVSLYIGSAVLRAALSNPGAHGGGGGGSNAGGAGTSSRVNGYGGAFSSGYNTSLDATTTYGMSTTPIGSVPVHTFDRGSVVQPPHDDARNGVSAMKGGAGLVIQGIGSQGFKGNLWESLIKNPMQPSSAGSTSSTSNPATPDTP